MHYYKNKSIPLHEAEKIFEKPYLRDTYNDLMDYTESQGKHTLFSTCGVRQFKFKSFSGKKIAKGVKNGKKKRKSD